MTHQTEKLVTIPLFPLNVVLFPEGSLQLRIFEPRYFDMVSTCMRQGSGFGICLSTTASGAGKRKTQGQIRFHTTGTMVEIVDWERLEDGLLGITVRGSERFKVVSTFVRRDRLVIGKVSPLSEVQEGMSGDYRSFSELLQEITARFELPWNTLPDRFNEAIWVSGRLAELLPFELVAKQRMLEMDNPLRRFDYMQVLLESLDTDNDSALQ